MKSKRLPRIIQFQHLGESENGFIDVAEFEKHIPFVVKRAFWVYQTPENLVRGNHAHYETELILIALTGKITVTTELPNGKIDRYLLDRSDNGIYLPPNIWRAMQYSADAVQLVFASSAYQEEDYIRDYKQFKEFYL